MAKEVYIYYNEITLDYSLGSKPRRRIGDDFFINMSGVISHLRYEINIGKIKPKRKIEIMTNAPKEDFEKLKKGLEKIFKNAVFKNKIK